MPLDGTLYHNDEILQILDAAQERIRDPKNWCQRSLHEVSTDGTEQWCARGAVLAEVACWGSPVDKLLNRAALDMGYSDLPGHELVNLNNTSDHPTVMAVFDLAREMCLSQILEEQKEFAHA